MYLKRETKKKRLIVNPIFSRAYVFYLIPLVIAIVIGIAILFNIENSNLANKNNETNDSPDGFDKQKDILDFESLDLNNIDTTNEILISQKTNFTNSSGKGKSSGGGGSGGGNPGGVDSGSGDVNEAINESSFSNDTADINITNPSNNNSTITANNTNQSVSLNNSQDNQENNQSNEGKKWSIKKLKSGFNLESETKSIDENDIFEGKNRFKFKQGNFQIAEFDIDFSKLDGDVDLGDITADINFGTGKAFMHSPKKILENITLYIPKLEGNDGVLICSNASSFDQIFVGCSNLPEITSEYFLKEGDPNLMISSDGLFYLVSGITGTGGNGANVTAGIPQTGNATYPGNTSAYAGNITFLAFSADSTTQSWQGFFGNVTGTIQLADSSSRVFYNWTLANPEGEIYASTNSTINWPSLQCFNFTANGTGGSVGETPGGTNLKGTNLSVLETRFNIASGDTDGVNETFSFNPVGDTHDLFYISNLEFTAGECLSTKVYSQTGPTANQFEEILLFDPVTYSVIFSSIIEEEGLNGFNNLNSDFEMLVLEDGHGSDVQTTTYYFFAELH